MDELTVLPTADDVATALATRLRDFCAHTLAGADQVHIALTGGTIAGKAYRALGELDTDAVDWSRVHLWWGDERFVAAGDDDRNDAGAYDALGGIADRVVRHSMPSSDSGLDLDAAGAAYADELGDRVLDLVLLGVGPDGHVASLFPEHPSLSTPGRVIPVRHSPKPPPDRVSLTLEVINAAPQVWLTVTGADKAAAVAAAHHDPVITDLPCTRVRGVHSTHWLLDDEAAGQLPGV